MWTLIYVASSEKMAQKIKTLLEEEGFLVKVQPSRSSKNEYEILVPNAEIKEAKDILPVILHKLMQESSA